MDDDDDDRLPAYHDEDSDEDDRRVQATRLGMGIGRAFRMEVMDDY